MLDDTPLSSLRYELDQSQVVVFAGGMGKRMGVSEPKALLKVNGQTLLDRSVRLFSSAGFSDFVFLLGHGHDKILRHLATGDMRGKRTSFSVDREPAFGRGKSLRYAMENGAIDTSKRCVVTFPDDIFTDEALPRRFLSEHLRNVRLLDSMGSVMLTRGMNWPYGAAQVDHSGLVMEFSEKPFISQPTSVGNYILETSVYELVSELVDMNHEGPVELESTVIPRLSRMGKLYGIFISDGCWLPVNTQKELEEAEKALASLQPELEPPSPVTQLPAPRTGRQRAISARTSQLDGFVDTFKSAL